MHFFQESPRSSFMSLPVHTFRKMPFDHSFLSKGVGFSVFFNSFFYHPLLLYQSMLLGGGEVACQSFHLSSCIALPFHTTRKNSSALILSSLYFSVVAFVIVYCSINPCFWEGVRLHAKVFIYHPVLLCHSILLGKIFYPYSLLWEGIDFIHIYIYINFFQEFLLSPLIALSIHAFGRGWMLHAKLFFYHPALLCHSRLLGRKNYPTLIHPFDRELILYTFIYTCISFKNLLYHPSCLSQSTLLQKCHSTTHSFLKGLSSLYFSIVSFIILYCSINPCFWEGVRLHAKLFIYHPALLCHSILLGKTPLPLF